nr:MAG TPA: hypothetical protein [Caudoviricetes sp.]
MVLKGKTTDSNQMIYRKKVAKYDHEMQTR